MTIKEAIIGSLSKVKCEELRDEKTGEIIEKEHDVFPMCFPFMLTSIASILVYLADQALKIDYPNVTVGGSKESGKAPKNITVMDYINVLTGGDFVSFMRGVNMRLQLEGFVQWWIEQDADNDDPEKLWYMHDSIAEMWNEYANIRRTAQNDK
jgi:hypothetical protein